MLFTSYNFIIFAAVLLLLYYTLPQKLQRPLLLAGSLIFYLCSPGKPAVYLTYGGIHIFCGPEHRQACGEKTCLPEGEP